MTVTRDEALDPKLLELLTFMDLAEAKPMSEGTPEEARTAFRTLTVDMRDPSAVPEVASVEDITVPGAEGDLPARVYRPVADGPLPTIAFFHGGGYVIGDLDTHDVTCRTIANLCAAVVVSVDYRLAPEHPAPAGVQDAISSARWVSEHLAELGGTDAMGVAGDSAGGNFSAVVAQTFRDEGRALAGQLLFYPGTDFDAAGYPSVEENAMGYFLDLPTVAWFMEQYVGHLDGVGLEDPVYSPINGDLAGLAPAVVVTAQFDPLRDQGNAYADKLRAAGVTVDATTFPGLIHGFVDMGRYSPAAQAAIEQTCAMFKAVLHP